MNLKTIYSTSPARGWLPWGLLAPVLCIVFAIVTGFMVVGAYPLGIGDEAESGDLASIVVSIALGLVLAYICFRKGKLMWGVLGIYISPIGIVGAMRLAKPTSGWAKKHYDETKMARSEERYGNERKAFPPDAPPRS